MNSRQGDLAFYYASEDMKAKKTVLRKARTTNALLDIVNDVLGQNGLKMEVKQEMDAAEVISTVSVYLAADPEQRTLEGAKAPINQRTSKGFGRAMTQSLRQAIYACFRIPTDI